VNSSLMVYNSVYVDANNMTEKRDVVRCLK